MDEQLALRKQGMINYRYTLKLNKIQKIKLNQTTAEMRLDNNEMKLNNRLNPEK